MYSPAIKVNSSNTFYLNRVVHTIDNKIVACNCARAEIRVIIVSYNLRDIIYRITHAVKENRQKLSMTISNISYYMKKV